MEVAGLSITVLHETFQITTFIIEVISTMKSQSSDFASLQIIFEHQQLYLQTLGKWFIADSKTGGAALLYRYDDRWRTNVMKMFLELRNLISGYTRLAVKYEPKYQELLNFIEEGTWIGTGSVVKGLEDLRLLTKDGSEVPLSQIFSFNTTAKESTTTSRSGPNLLQKLSKKYRLLDWALFDYKRLLELVGALETWTKRLRDLMQFALLPCISENVAELKSFTKPENKSLGFSRLAETRLAILKQMEPLTQEVDVDNVSDYPEPGPSQKAETSGTPSTVVSPNNASRPSSAAVAPEKLVLKKMAGQALPVLVEYKIYQNPFGERGLTSSSFEITQERIRDISRLLSVGHDGINDDLEKPQSFTLKCLGYFHEPSKQRFGLIFQIPLGVQPQPISLYSVIKTCGRDARPSLGQRFAIGHLIGKTLLEWFLVDWVHKSISSREVWFFRPSEASASAWSFSSPYLGGFEYARKLDSVSNEAYGPWQFEEIVYRHPARQGAPTERFHKSHDVYAFGVMLLEIGLWQVARELFPPAERESHRVRPAHVHQILLHNARTRLGHYMGERYTNAVLSCLESKFGITNDDGKETKLVMAFKEQVVDVLETAGAGL